MKRYLTQLAAFSLLALAMGCQKEEGEIGNPKPTQSTAINISIDGLPIDAASSRATIADMPDFSANGFKIAGYYTVGTPDPGRSGRFDDNISTATPNVFDYDGTSTSTGKSVIVPALIDGEYHVTLSQWGLLENSYLSYFAWASNVGAGVAEGAATNPIVNSTKHGDPGAPFIQVTSGSTSASLNVDVVAAKYTDNSNDVVRSSIDLDFKHVMTKLKFNVKNISSVEMTLTGARILFAAGVGRTATYSFDGSTSHIGTWGACTNTTAAAYPIALTTTKLAVNADAVHLEELLIIPQALAARAISVELTYTIPNGTGTSTYTRTAPLKARTFEQNTSYTHEISLSETQVSINEGRIGEWIETSTGDLPYVAGPRDPKVQLLLDAYDPPYTHTDGTKYWLDRSGWNRHCKMNGNITYKNDANGKYYSFTDDPVDGCYMEVTKPFEKTEQATFDLIIRTTRPTGETGQQHPFYFVYPQIAGGSGDHVRTMFMHFGMDGGGSYHVDAGEVAGGWAQFTRSTDAVPLAWLNAFAMYSFSKQSVAQGFYRNLSYLNNAIDSKYKGHQKIDLSTAMTRRIGWRLKGDIKYIKIEEKYATEISKDNFATLEKRHKLPEDTYIQEGLLVDLRGTDPLAGGVWTNRAATGAKYNATMQGDKSLITYNAAGKYYQIGTAGITVPNGGPAYFFINPITAGLTYLETFTIEMVFKSHLGAHDCLMIQTANDQTERGIFYSSYYSDGKIRYQAPSDYRGGFSQLKLDEGLFLKPPATAPAKDNPIGTTQIRSNVLVRSFAATAADTYLKVYVDNYKIAETINVPPNYPVGTPRTIKIGQGGIQISAFRIYNRVLTETERTYNNRLDQTKYNIPPIRVK